MPARGGNWALLDQSSDPIVADVPVVQELVTYYKTIAEEITSEADVLRRIGDGDDSQFKGSTADAVRKKSKEVAASLTKMSGRYDAIRDALTAYLPELQHALDESAGALRDAEEADAAGTRAASMPDPSKDRAQDAPPMTTEEQDAVSAKGRAASAAQGDSDAAKARLHRALDGITTAGKAAAATIRESWHDGLHDTLGDKIKAFFSKLLKMIVKIFTYIGIALAALAILIPGVGVLAIMGAVAAGVGLVAQLGLVAIGEGNVFDLVMAVVGVATLGIGSGIAKATSVAVKSGLKAGKVSMTAKLGERLAPLKDFRSEAIGKINSLKTQIGGKTGAVEHVDGAMSGFTQNALRDVGTKGLGAAKTISDQLRRNLEPLVEQKGALQGGIKSAEAQIVKQEGLVRGADDLIAANMKDVDRAIGAFTSKFPDNPNWWNLRQVGTTAKNDWSTVSKQFGSDLFTKKGFDGWAERLAGIDGQVNRSNIDKWLGESGFAGVGSSAPKWHAWVNGGMSAQGKAYSITGLVINPTMMGNDQQRPWTESYGEFKHPITT
ncbi:WXG100 family type VII secretion target [Curtobacterium herbarum]|uniref:WXG100 family type VII secretion target n=1 Tax=Curtobacterium herbarum TaxID=150122 RepID=UPI001956B23E|nr:hypothetical protein [Curtobacterium herbarum]MBM7473764.1 hypothetical protein [Curtobacterium herbarum]MCS6544903.1 hypothetical protein [Curtobacterium herbarum]